MEITCHRSITFAEGTEVHNNSSVRPYFEEPLHSISVSVGEEAIFKCAAKGNPTPVFKWYAFVVFLVSNFSFPIDKARPENMSAYRTIHSILVRTSKPYDPYFSKYKCTTGKAG